jgi:hypothetical protein
MPRWTNPARRHANITHPPLASATSRRVDSDVIVLD